MPDAQRPTAGFCFRAISIVGVSAYLVACYAWLVMSKRVRGAGFVAHAFSRLKPRYRARLDAMRHADGHCWVATLPAHLRSDREGMSRLRVLENDHALPRPHALHAEIGTLGAGRFSHWGDTLYFSTSDNSDPTSNGRRYRVEEA